MRQTLSRELRDQAEEKGSAWSSVDWLRERQERISRDLEKIAERIAEFTKEYKATSVQSRRMQLKQMIMGNLRRRKILENRFRIIEARLFNEDQLAFRHEEVAHVAEDEPLKDLTTVTIDGNPEDWDISALVSGLNEINRLLCSESIECNESEFADEAKELERVASAGIVPLTGIMQTYKDQHCE
jgi:hypothetical protein